MADQKNTIQKSEKESGKKTSKTSDRESGAESEISGVEFALIGLVAVIKDLTDIIGTITVIGIILTILINIPATLILWFWCAIKFKHFPTKRFLTTSLIEFIPLIGALPVWTGFVVSLYFDQKGFLPKFFKKSANP